MTTTQPLAPIHACPWCNPDHAGLAPRVNTANGTQHWVFCPECGMHGPCGIGEAEAVERWNIVCSRTPSVLPGARREDAIELAVAIGAHLERICLGHKPTREELDDAVRRGLTAHEHVFCPHCKPCRLAPTIAECEDAMRELASYVSAGGYGGLRFEPKKLAKAIREQIDAMVTPPPSSVQAEAAKRQLPCKQCGAQYDSDPCLFPKDCHCQKAVTSAPESLLAPSPEQAREPVDSNEERMRYEATCAADAILRMQKLYPTRTPTPLEPEKVRDVILGAFLRYTPMRPVPKSGDMLDAEAAAREIAGKWFVSAGPENGKLESEAIAEIAAIIKWHGGER